MLGHTAKRVYRNSELPLWYRRALCAWERRFKPEEISYGRKLYKLGVVRDLELESDEAVVCAKMPDGNEPYCVVDFSGDEFTYRGSQSDDFLTAALTVAGFYEIEELVADIAALPEFADFNWEFSQTSEEPPANAAEAEPAGGADVPSTHESVSAEAVKNMEPEEAVPPMELLLKFSSRRRGLSFCAHWIMRDGKKRKAFGDNCLPVDSLSSAECENLIRLATFARRSGFKYESEMYVLSEISKIPIFLSSELPRWKRYFTIKKDRLVDLLKLGERRVQLRPSAKSVSGDSADFDVEWAPCIGDESIDASELGKLVGGASSVRIIPDYGIVRVSSADSQFVRNVEQSRDFGFAGGKIPRYMLLSLSDFGARITLGADLKKWMDSLLRKTEAACEELPEFLRRYQRLGVNWAMNLFSHDCNAMIADEMGLGKTIQTLTLIDIISREPGALNKFLVVCPASVIPVWVSETKKFFPNIKTGILSSNANFDGAPLWISSYTQLRRNRQLVENNKFDLAVLDEAQFIKNPDAKTTVACMSISARRKIALTGTPVENKLLDLWTSFRWLMPGLMGQRKTFERAAANDASVVDDVRRQVAPFVLRRLKSEVERELPEKVNVDLLCPMNEQQKSEYNKLLLQARRELEGSLAPGDAGARFTVLSLLTRLRQAACDAALLPWIGPEGASEPGGKISVLLDRVDELYQGGKKVLIFSQFTKFLNLAKTYLSERVGSERIFDLTGSTRDRSQPVEAFQNTEGSALMLVSLRAGGTGITLTSADYVFLADPWWNPAVEEQAIDRVHRIGRKGDVFVYRMFAEDSVEDKVRKLQMRKRKMFDDLVGGLSDVSDRAKFIETIADILS